jgi:hypothetical protein
MTGIYRPARRLGFRFAVTSLYRSAREGVECLEPSRAGEGISCREIADQKAELAADEPRMAGDRPPVEHEKGLELSHNGIVRAQGTFCVLVAQAPLMNLVRPTSNAP